MRVFVPNEMHHTYQRTMNGYNIFYEIEDYLVYYTIFSVMSRRYGIVVYGLCLMIDHIHSLISGPGSLQFSRFIMMVTRTFMKEYNAEHHRSGPLFCRAFGSSPKLGAKKIRTAIAYLYNNPVERHLCKSAQEYRWNFLAYCTSSHPYSDPIVFQDISRSLRRAIEEVNGTFERQSYLTYNQLKRIFASMEKKERSMFVDYVIVRYSVIRYDRLTTMFYEGAEKMLVAINSNAGSEYEINEVKYARSDADYRKLYRYLHAKGYDNAGYVISADNRTKDVLMNDMLRKTGVARFQICKYLHISFGT